MTNLKLPKIFDYDSAMAYFDEHGENVGYKTTIYPYSSSTGTKFFGIVHHGTTILKYFSTGMIVGDNGGYHSSTTRNRLHRLTPNGIFVFQRNNKQMISGVNGEFEFMYSFAIYHDLTVETDLSD